MENSDNPVKQKILPVNLLTKAELYQAYMPFVKGGGLFVPTKDMFNLGDEVFLLVKLMEETEKHSVPGRVIWMTPKGAQGGMVSGVGVQLNATEAETLRKKIETYLAGALDSDRATWTM